MAGEFRQQAFRRLISAACIGPVLAAASAQAQGGRSIVEEAQRRASARSLRYEGTLQVLDPSGRIAEKRWRFARLGSQGSSKAVLRFTAPAEVKGVALLILNHPDRASDQWMWTPTLQRDRRIAPQDRSARLLGTDFTFEDLEERDLGQFDFKLLGEEPVDGIACWRIESRPRKSKVSQYDSSTLWIRKASYVLVRADGFIRGKLAKRLSFRELEQVSGIWTARLVEARDIQRQSRTLLRLDRIEYDAPLKDEDFRLIELRREP